MTLISRFLASDDVVAGLDVADKDGALEAAASMAARRHDIDQALVYRALWRREQMGSTGLGHGIAVPHARIPGIGQPIVLLLRTKNPIAFGAPDRKPVSVLFVILVPENANDEHLQILAAASTLFSEPAFRERLESAADPAAIQRLFGEAASPNAQ